MRFKPPPPLQKDIEANEMESPQTQQSHGRSKCQKKDLRILQVKLSLWLMTRLDNVHLRPTREPRSPQAPALSINPAASTRTLLLLWVELYFPQIKILKSQHPLP